MKTIIVTLILATAALARAAATSAAETGSNLPSPAQRRIDAARLVLAKQPNRYQAYNELALALVRRARETGDTRYYQQAEQAVDSSLRIQPENFEGRQAHVALLLGEHRYPQALAEAQILNRATPDAVNVWGYLAEADAALGDYDQAEKAAQWMMNLRPGNVPAYLCGAALREDWGDVAGALDFLSKALQATPPIETEETAWILTAMARLNRLSGSFDAADALLQGALKSFPDYYLALEESTQLRMTQGRYADAVDLMEKRNQTFPSLQSRYLLAEALEDAGRAAEARAAYQQFESEARSRIDAPDNDNRELVLYYTGRAKRADEALRIARLEFGRRHDVWTVDAYAWALYCNGQNGEATRQMDKVMKVGARDATLVSHAASIFAAAGDKAAANRFLKMSSAINPALVRPLLAAQTGVEGVCSVSKHLRVLRAQEPSTGRIQSLRELCVQRLPGMEFAEDVTPVGGGSAARFHKCEDCARSMRHLAHVAHYPHDICQKRIAENIRSQVFRRYPPSRFRRV